MKGIAFAGNNEDTVTDLYDAQFREYGVQGRWPSPDPAGLAAVNPANPQSWNRYAYVLNNPLSLIDPLGLWLEEIGGCYFDTVAVYVNGEFQGYSTNFDGCIETGGGGGFVDAGGGGGGGAGGGEGLGSNPAPVNLSKPSVVQKIVNGACSLVPSGSTSSLSGGIGGIGVKRVRFLL